MNSTSYTIGATARMVGVSDSTLRAWERCGLIPTPGRSSDGRRQYSELDVARIRDLARRRREEDPMKWRRPAGAPA